MNIFPYICDIPTSIFHIPTLKTLNKTVERAGRGGGEISIPIVFQL